MKTRLILGALVLLFSSTANAVIVDSADHSYLTDTNTGLDWLDVTLTAGLTYNYVSSQLGNGGVYEGWQYATGDQFNELVGNYTGPAINTYSRVVQEPDLIDGLIVLLGSTIDVAWQNEEGMTWDAFYGYQEGSGLDVTSGIIAELNVNDPNKHVLAALWHTDGIGVANGQE